VAICGTGTGRAGVTRRARHVMQLPTVARRRRRRRRLKGKRRRSPAPTTVHLIYALSLDLRDTAVSQHTVHRPRLVQRSRQQVHEKFSARLTRKPIIRSTFQYSGSLLSVPVCNAF